MRRPTRARVARLAKLFAELAVLFAELAIEPPPRGPARGAAPAPRGRAHTKVGLEGARERGGRAEAVVERHLEHASVGHGGQHAGGALEPEALDEREERLAGDRAEHAVEVKRREGRHVGQRRERQLLTEARSDVIDHPIDAPYVFLTIPFREQYFASLTGVTRCRIPTFNNTDTGFWGPPGMTAGLWNPERTSSRVNVSELEAGDRHPSLPAFHPARFLGRCRGSPLRGALHRQSCRNHGERLVCTRIRPRRGRLASQGRG